MTTSTAQLTAGGVFQEVDGLVQMHNSLPSRMRLSTSPARIRTSLAKVSYVFHTHSAPLIESEPDSSHNLQGRICLLLLLLLHIILHSLFFFPKHTTRPLSFLCVPTSSNEPCTRRTARFRSSHTLAWRASPFPLLVEPPFIQCIASHPYFSMPGANGLQCLRSSFLASFTGMPLAPPPKSLQQHG